MSRCTFCPRPAPGEWAMTAQAVDGSWRREILPLCIRCDALNTSGRQRGAGAQSYGREMVRRSHLAGDSLSTAKEERYGLRPLTAAT
jgi:hypothetical protein